MYAEHCHVTGWYAYCIVNDVYDVDYEDVVQEHPMVRAETKYPR